MLKVECEACKAPYQVDERRVPPSGLKMRCPKCGHSFVVAHPNAPGGAAPSPDAQRGPPRPGPPPPRPRSPADPMKRTMVGVGGPDGSSPVPLTPGLTDDPF